MLMRITVLALVLCCIAFVSPSTTAHAQGAVTITGIATNYDSVKVHFLPVPGAKDYRIFDANVPNTVKYAGVWHLFSPYPYLFQTDSNGLPLIPDALVVPFGGKSTPTEADVPGLEIEMNGLTPGIAYNLVVQAVDALGPVAACCMYNANNAPITTCPAGCPGCRLGMNSCCTKDGKISTNGQGLAANNPNVIAAATFTVTPSGASALPSSRLATQVLFEPFSSGTITPAGTANPAAGVEYFSMQTPAATWGIQTEDADIINSAVFLDHNHFMDVLFDGGTPGTSNPMHVGHGLLALSPLQTVNYSGGQILHLTAEIDSHLGEDARRYADFRLTPANDPYIGFDALVEQINNTDTDLEIEINSSTVAVYQCTGPSAPGNAQSIPNQVAVVGGNRPNLFLGTNGYQNGRGLDNRTRFDAFISTTQIAIYEDGMEIAQGNFPAPLPFSAAKVYFAAYHYHSALEVQELMLYSPWENYWINTFPYSDERHWDNMGYEVFPANTSWSGLVGLVQPPTFQPPVPVPSAASFVGKDTTTQGNWIGKYGSDGYNVINDAIDYPSYSSVNVSDEDQYYTWLSSTNEVQCPEKVSIPGDRIGAWLYAYPGFTIDINLTDGKTHQVAVYNLDNQVTGGIGGQTIQVFDANTGAVLDSRTVSGFFNGTYMIWNLTGHIQLQFNNPGWYSAISGIFFDTPQGTAALVPTSMVFNPTSVIGGFSSTGTVTISGAAPTGGLIVKLSTTNPAAVPATVTVASGSTTATFTVTTSAVTTTATPSITATANGTSASRTLTVTAPNPVPTSVTLNPTSVIGGASSTGTVTISGAAPTGGLIVNLSTTNPAAVPGTVTVASGSTTATFTVTTSAVTTTATPSITATANGTSASGTLTVTALNPVPSSVTLNPTSVTGGASSTGTVTISGAAPTGGLIVNLSTSNPAAVPATVTVTAGSTTATFTVTTSAVTTTATPAITATANGKSASGTLTVTAPNPVPTGLTLNPTSVTGGTSSTGTVTISGAAPTGGLIVNLSTSNPAAVPATVTVTAGSTTATFTVTTSAVTTTATPAITATANGKSASGTLTVIAAVPTSMTLNPTSVTGGTSSTGTVTLSGPAPTGGLIVKLSTTNPAAVPASATVTAGNTSAKFTVTTIAVAATATPSISATANGTSVSATLTVTVAQPVFESSVYASPATLNLGSTTNIHAQIYDAGGPLQGGVVVCEIYDANGNQVQQWNVTGQNFTKGKSLNYTWTWTPASRGTYTVKLGVYGANLTPLYYWTNNAATITVH